MTRNPIRAIAKRLASPPPKPTVIPVAQVDPKAPRGVYGGDNDLVERQVIAAQRQIQSRAIARFRR